MVSSISKKILKRVVEKMTCKNYFKDEILASSCGMFVYTFSNVTVWEKKRKIASYKKLLKIS